MGRSTPIRTTEIRDGTVSSGRLLSELEKLKPLKGTAVKFHRSSKAQVLVEGAQSVKAVAASAHLQAVHSPTRANAESPVEPGSPSDL